MSPYIEKALNIDQDLETDIQLYIVYSPAGGEEEMLALILTLSQSLVFIPRPLPITSVRIQTRSSDSDGHKLDIMTAV